MTKNSFIDIMKNNLTILGYTRYRNYWYKENNGYLLCINIQGSQWDKNTYYVEFGVAFFNSTIEHPSVLHWNYRHRCIGKNGDTNIQPSDLVDFINEVHNTFPTLEELPAFFLKQNAVKVGNQYWW